MGKKKGKKKKKKGKKKKDDAPNPDDIPTMYDEFPIDQIKKEQGRLKTRLARKQNERNYVQLERDTIQTFYDITKNEVSDLNLAISAKDKEMETMEQNHRVEVRVYIQKVKHLDYEHRNNTRRVTAEGESAMDDEKEGSTSREAALKEAKKSLKLERKERQLAQEDEIREWKEKHSKNLGMLRKEFTNNLNALEGKYKAKVKKLREDLELRRKVDIHEIEERKNLHINDLMKNHESAFGQIKNYYNDITHDNLKLIKELSAKKKEMKKTAASNQALMYEIAQENQRLSEPLTAATKEVDSLEGALKDYRKDKQSLKNAQARLTLVSRQCRGLEASHRKLSSKFNSTERERDDLYATFEETISQVQEKAEMKNLALARRLSAVSNDFEAKNEQFHEVLSKANQDPMILQEITSKLDMVIDQRNGLIRDLRHDIARVTKKHNDIVRTLDSKLGDLGISAEEIGTRQLMTRTSVGPAGLLA